MSEKSVAETRVLKAKQKKKIKTEEEGRGETERDKDEQKSPIVAYYNSRYFR